MDTKRILKAFKKNFRCNGAAIEDKTLGDVIQLQGDQRSNARDFMVEMQICKREEVQVHGF